MALIETAQPEEQFADVYRQAIHERFAGMDKDELIHRLLWLQLKDTMEAYRDARDLNAGYDQSARTRGGGEWVRLFINLGTKDGMNPARLVDFIAGQTDIEPNLIDRVTVRELSSFFNVRGDAAEFIRDVLPTKKFKNRKIRVDEAEQRRREDAPRSYKSRVSEDRFNKTSNFGSHKFNKKYK
jgi:ATP-dependent RNA helicase DeaD